MLFPETIYEKDIPSTPDARRLVMYMRDGYCEAAVWDNSQSGSLRIVSTPHIHLDENKQWVGLEDFLYDNPGLLAPMGQTTVLIDAEDAVIIPNQIPSGEASALLRLSATTDVAEDTAKYIESWETESESSTGILIPAKTSRFLHRSFQPMTIKWSTSAIAGYCQKRLQQEETERKQFNVFISASTPGRITIVMHDSQAKLLSAINRTGTAASDFAFHVISLLKSIGAKGHDDTIVSIIGTSPETAGLKEILSGYADVRYHTYISGKPHIIDSTQIHLLSFELLAGIESL